MTAKKPSCNIILPLIFISTFLIYAITSKGPTPFDYYTRLSKSLLQGKIYLTENPSWLNELIPNPKNPSQFFVAYPPMPTIISLPFILLDKNISQTTIAIIIGSLNAVLAYLIAKKLVRAGSSRPNQTTHPEEPGAKTAPLQNNNKMFKNFDIKNLNLIKNLKLKIKNYLGLINQTTTWIFLLFAFGTNHFFLSTVGSAWYFAHIVSIFFLFLAILETLNKKRPLLIGLLLGASYWSRLPTILSLPFFILMMFENCNIENSLKIARPEQSREVNCKLKIKYLIKLFLGLSIFLFLNFIYNYLRFGTVIDIGYTLIPNVLNEPWYRYGIFSLKYIPDHLKIIFTAIPEIKNQFPYVFPGFVGLALWFVTPAFVIALKAPLKRLMTLSSWLSIFLISLPSLMHGTVGFSQFGYRFAMDYTPFLIILTTLGIGKNIRWPHKILIILSIIVNLWGVLLSRFSLAQF